MDPNEALNQAREAVRYLRAQLDSEDPNSSAIEQEATRLSEHFTVLDEWLSKGGFAPSEWLTKRTVEIVHGRDPDEGCEHTVFVDGARVDAYVEDIDPGRGYERESWDENIEAIRTQEGLSEAFREHAIATREAYGDSKYITD